MPRRALALLLLLLLVARALPVISLSDVFFLGEEQGKSAAGKVMLANPGIDHHDLVYAYHEGGGFAVSHLQALAFLLVGENVVATKLVALLFGALILCAGFRLASEHFGPRAGLVFGLLYVLCPQPYQRFSLIALGTHFEALLFVALVLHATLRILAASGSRMRDWAMLGLSAGFGLYFSLQIGPALGAAGLYLLFGLRARLFGRGLCVAIGTFALGAAPLAWMVSEVGRAALGVRGETGQGGGLVGWPAFREMLAPLWSPPEVFAWAWAAGPLLLLAGAWLGASRRGDGFRRPAGLVGLYAALFLLSYGWSGFALADSGHWFALLRTSPLFLAVALLASACAARLIEHGTSRWREIAAGVVGVLLIGGLSALAGLLVEGRPAEPGGNAWLLARTRGYDWNVYLDRLASHLDGTPGERLEILARIDDADEALLPAAAEAVLRESGTSPVEALAMLRRTLGDRWRAALPGLGLVVAPDYGHDVPAALARIGALEPEVQAGLAEALGRVALGIKLEEERVQRQVRLDVGERLRAPFLRGAGFKIHRMHRLRPDLATSMIGRLPMECWPAVTEGYLAARAADRFSAP